MAAVASHPELYDALREVGVSEPRARAAEHATPRAEQVATKAEVKEKVTEEIRPVERTLAKLLTAAIFIGGLTIANFFFAAHAWISVHHLANSALPQIRMEIAENRTMIEANARGIEANAKAIAENRAMIEANSKKLDEVSQKLDEVILLLQVAQRE